MEAMGKECKSSLKAQVEWSQRGWRKERPPLQNSSEPLSIPELSPTQTRMGSAEARPFLGDASYTTLQILRKDVPWARCTGGPEYGSLRRLGSPPPAETKEAEVWDPSEK